METFYLSKMRMFMDFPIRQAALRKLWSFYRPSPDGAFGLLDVNMTTIKHLETDSTCSNVFKPESWYFLWKNIYITLLHVYCRCQCQKQWPMTEKDHHPEEIVREGFMFTQYETIRSCMFMLHVKVEFHHATKQHLSIGTFDTDLLMLFWLKCHWTDIDCVRRCHCWPQSLRCMVTILELLWEATLWMTLLLGTPFF